MRKAKILYKDEEAGILTQHNDGSFTFSYSDKWMKDPEKPAISLTLPKTQQSHQAQFLFPFFYNMLPEGANKQAICKHNKIDRDDHFGLLMTVAKSDTIGAVKVLKIDHQ